MSFVKITLDLDFGDYFYDKASNDDMATLGCFLATDVGCYSSEFEEWALADKEAHNSQFGYYLGSNAIQLEETRDGYIWLEEDLPIDADPQKFKISKEQYLKLLNDWKEKVCKYMPKEVIITYENDQFVIETKQ